MTHFFQFEADFVDSLRCIPMEVRMKLDTCGIKLKLAHWHQFTQEERLALVEKPITTPEESEAYGKYLQQLVVTYTGIPASNLPIEPNPPWLDANTIPANLQTKAQEIGVILTEDKWATLTPEKRFALIKLSHPSHESKNFLPALKEFKLL